MANLLGYGLKQIAPTMEAFREGEKRADEDFARQAKIHKITMQQLEDAYLNRAKTEGKIMDLIQKSGVIRGMESYQPKSGVEDLINSYSPEDLRKAAELNPGIVDIVEEAAQTGDFSKVNEWMQNIKNIERSPQSMGVPTELPQKAGEPAGPDTPVVDPRIQSIELMGPPAPPEEDFVGPPAPEQPIRVSDVAMNDVLPVVGEGVVEGAQDFGRDVYQYGKLGLNWLRDKMTPGPAEAEEIYGVQGPSLRDFMGANPDIMTDREFGLAKAKIAGDIRAAELRFKSDQRAAKEELDRIEKQKDRNKDAALKLLDIFGKKATQKPSTKKPPKDPSYGRARDIWDDFEKRIKEPRYAGGSRNAALRREARDTLSAIRATGSSEAVNEFRARYKSLLQDNKPKKPSEVPGKKSSKYKHGDYNRTKQFRYDAKKGTFVRKDKFKE